MDPQLAASIWQGLNSVGIGGLAFITWALMTGRLITRREYDGMAQRCERLEQKLDKALEYGHRAVDAGKTLLDKHPNA